MLKQSLGIKMKWHTLALSLIRQIIPDLCIFEKKRIIKYKKWQEEARVYPINLVTLDF